MFEQYRNHPLAEAARYNDAIAEERGLLATIAEMGIDMDTLMHVVEQRAMRCAILKVRGPEALHELGRATTPTVMQLSDEEKALIKDYILTYIDGIAIGWKAKELSK